MEYFVIIGFVIVIVVIFVGIDVAICVLVEFLVAFEYIFEDNLYNFGLDYCFIFSVRRMGERREGRVWVYIAGAPCGARSFFQSWYFIQPWDFIHSWDFGIAPGGLSTSLLLSFILHCCYRSFLIF